MKIIVTILVAAALGFAGAYFYVSKQSRARFGAAQAEYTAKNQQLNAALSTAANEAARLKLTVPPQILTPADILQRLALIDPSTPELRSRKIREIIHHLECLVDAGTNAILPMRHFIAAGADVDYAFEDGKAAGATSLWYWRPGMELRSGLILPPTLRIALVDVFRYIGGEGAEVSLAWMMANSAHGMEVPYIAQALESIAPGRYTQISLQAAVKELTSTNAPASRTDAAGDAYVYNWLSAHGDTSLVAVARQNLVNPQGKFDVDAARYLVGAAKSEAMPDLAKVYDGTKDNDLKNQIANLSLNYVGASPAADTIFKDWIGGSDVEGAPGTINARPRELAIRMLGGGNFGPFRAPTPSDPQVISNRLNLLNELKPKLTTARLQQAVDQTIQALTALQTSH